MINGERREAMWKRLEKYLHAPFDHFTLFNAIMEAVEAALDYRETEVAGDDEYQPRKTRTRAKQWTGDNDAELREWLEGYGLTGFECDWREDPEGQRDFIVEDCDDDGISVGEWVVLTGSRTVGHWDVEFLSDKLFNERYTRAGR